YARLASAEVGTRNAEQQRDPPDANDPPRPFRVPTSAFRVVEAMLRHPELIAGEGRACTELMRAHPGRVIAKVGAEGVYCALLPQEGLGVALKVADGHALASALAMAAVLEALGLRPRPASLASRPNVNTRGDTVGEMRVNGGLQQ
ncbi:MAG TPA: asparaginase, partial [Gemmatimonadales bacterium]|nr:asparaginase [Gemmatimonadales bacterium]